MSDWDVAPERAQELVNQGAKLIDVRTVEEFAEGAVPGAVNVPLHTLPIVAFEHVAKGDTVVVYCRSGGRSGRATEWLRSQGVANTFNGGGVYDLLEIWDDA